MNSAGTPGESIEVILARIETKLDSALADVNDHEARIRELERINNGDHEARLRKVEHALWLSAGAAAAAGGGIGATLSALFQIGN